MPCIRLHTLRFGWLAQCAWVLACAGTPFAAGASWQVEAERLDGSLVKGELQAWSGEELVIQQEQGLTTIAAEQMLALRPGGPPPSNDSDVTPEPSPPEAEAAPTVIHTIDGSRLAVTGLSIVDRLARFDSPLGKSSLQLATNLIDTVELSRLEGPLAELWQEARDKEAVGDLLLVLKRGGDSGDYLTGILGDLRDDVLQFEWDSDVVPVRLSKVAALRYYHAQRRPSPEPVCRLTLQDGQLVAVARLELEGETLQIVTPSQLRLSIALGRLSSADFSAGKLVYLSDLVPVASRWTPQIGLPASAETVATYGRPRRDESFAGTELSLKSSSRMAARDHGVTQYRKGLAVRSRTEIAYRIPAGMLRFRALAGIDPQTWQTGHVWVEVFGDRERLWQGEVAGGSAPVEIDVPLSRARTLRLVVDYGENLDFGDRLHLINARMTK
jgi:hypothetical protein